MSLREMKSVALMLIVLKCVGPVCAKTKDPQAKRDAQDRVAYAKQVEREVELEGWESTVFAVGKNPCGAICLGGDHISLRVWLGYAPAEGMVRFYKTELEPRLQQLQAKGFVAIEIRSYSSSSNFPDGVWNIPITKALQSASNISAPSQNVDKRADSASDGERPTRPIASSTTHGVLGIQGANWEEDGYYGVEIRAVANDGAAEIAGLRVGYVITEIDGSKIRSTTDLAEALARDVPGTKINLGYLVKTNLGWIPKEASLILGR